MQFQEKKLKNILKKAILWFKEKNIFLFFKKIACSCMSSFGMELQP